MKRGLTVAGALLVALGVVAIAESLRLKDDWQGAKLLPAVVGAILVVLGVAHARLGADGVAWPDRAGLRRVTLLLAGVVLYVGLLPELGFLVATALFTLGLVRALGAYSWARAGAWTVVIAVATHVLFRRWLGMPLPTGPLGF